VTIVIGHVAGSMIGKHRRCREVQFLLDSKIFGVGLGCVLDFIDSSV